MLKIVIALVLVAHGIGHSMGLMQVFKIATVNPQWHGDSWLLTGPFGPAGTNVVAVAVWTAAMVGFMVLGAIVMGWLPEAWFAPVAIGSSVVSIAGLVLFPIAFPVFSTIGAFAVNVAVLAAVLWFDWVPSDLAAS